MHDTLAGLFSPAERREMDCYGLSLPRIAAFIQDTLDIGGTVARLTLHLPTWIRLFAPDGDGRELIEGVAYGVDFSTMPGGDAPSQPGGPGPWAPRFVVPNYVPEDMRERVDTQIRKEFALGRIARARPGYLGISALGAVLKGDGPKIRVIHDYSRPRVGGVNASVRVRKETFARVADAAALLRPGAYHCKVDITEAYRAFPMAPQWWTRHVFEWDGVVYSDLRLPFGSSGAPSAFHRFSAAFARVVKARAFHACVPYLDDFWLSA